MPASKPLRRRSTGSSAPLCSPRQAPSKVVPDLQCYHPEGAVIPEEAEDGEEQENENDEMTESESDGSVYWPVQNNGSALVHVGG